VSSVDFWVIGFDVNFGAPPGAPPPLALLDFWTMLHKPGPEAAPDSSHQQNGQIQSLLILQNVGQHSNNKPEQTMQTVEGAAFKYILEGGNSPQPTQTSANVTKGTKNIDPGTQWFVRGGSFKFRIASDFAISDASIEQADTKTPTKASSPLKIYSTPMHIENDGKGIKSTLKITIRNLKTQELVHDWSTFELVTKDVPTAIWNPYDPKLDPKFAPKQLLNGDNPTVKQCMSLAISAPAVQLSPPPNWPGFIPKFNLTEVANIGILDYRYIKARGTDWFMPTSLPMQNKYLQLQFSEAELEQSNADRWNNTRKTWSGLSTKSEMVNHPESGLLNLFAKTLGWDQNTSEPEQTTQSATIITPAAPAVPTTNPHLVSSEPSTTLPANEAKNSTASTNIKSIPRAAWELVGSLPSKMISDLEGTYLSLPRIAVVF
jgi:hypothetical protein